MNIGWYPGHMAKARRQLAESLKQIDAVCEIVDARIPCSSRNPDIEEICGNKPRLMIFNRIDQANPAHSKRWSAYYRNLGIPVLEADSKSGAGINKFPEAVRQLLKEKLDALRRKGQVGRTIRVMVVGIPNVGKSTFINKVVRRKAANVEDRPGVTRGKQWLKAADGIELLDTPGILWPKLGDEKTGLNLAFTGAIRDDVMDVDTLSTRLMETLAHTAPGALNRRYGIGEDGQGHELLEAAARKRGFIISGGEPDIARMSRVLLDEFRGGKLGRITLELPGDAPAEKESNEGE